MQKGIYHEKMPIFNVITKESDAQCKIARHFPDLMRNNIALWRDLRRKCSILDQIFMQKLMDIFLLAWDEKTLRNVGNNCHSGLISLKMAHFWSHSVFPKTMILFTRKQKTLEICRQAPKRNPENAYHQRRKFMFIFNKVKKTCTPNRQKSKYSITLKASLTQPVFKL